MYFNIHFWYISINYYMEYIYYNRIYSWTGSTYFSIYYYKVLKKSI